MVTEFNNARLANQNFSFGPDLGRIYSIDYVSGTMLVKNDPAGVLDVPVALVKTIPLNTAISSEVQTLQYDGFYFWTQRSIGGSSPIGTLVEKWALAPDGNTLLKQFGVGNEISIVSTPSQLVNSEAMAVHVLARQFTSSASTGVTVLPADDASLIQPGDVIYLGPNNSDEREELEVLSAVGTNITVTTPIQFNYSAGHSISVRKNIWIFNNRNGLQLNEGQLKQYSTYTGFLISTSSSNEWKDVSAATSFGSDLYFIRDTQYLRYTPSGLSQGYKVSGIVNNTEADKNTLIKVYDISINNSALSKLQLSLTEFNTLSKEFIDIPATDNQYQIEREFFAAKVKSLTATRNTRSIAFAEGVEMQLTVEVRDQYNIPVLGRSITIFDDDATGFIKPGQESFITDSQGRGVTTYVTGAGLDFANPLITAIDVISDLRGTTRVQQLQSLNESTYMQQVIPESTTTRLVQQEIVSDMPLQQTLLGDIAIPLEQVQVQTSKRQLEQVLSSLKLPVIQSLQTLGVIPMDQIPPIETITTLNQYIFLIFAIPEPYSKKNDPTTNILLRIVGFGGLTLIPSTLSLKINGVEVSSQTSVTAFAGGLELEYDPSVDFSYGSRVVVELSIEDSGLPANVVTITYYFDIIEDFRRPTVSQLFPPDNSTGNAIDTEIFAIVTDAETGIDVDSIEMYVEGRLVPHTTTEPSPGSVKITYVPTCEFPYQASINASVIVVDNSGNKLIETWTFYVQQSPGVLFIDTVPANCQVLVPVDTELCSEVFGLEEGVHIGSLTFDINGESVNYVLKPRVYRKE